MSASIDKSDRNYEKAARNARVARILFWTNFIGLAAILLLGNYLLQILLSLVDQLPLAGGEVVGAGLP